MVPSEEQLAELLSNLKQLTHEEPTKEELFVIFALRNQHMQLLESREVYSSVVDSLSSDFKDVSCIFPESDCHHADPMKPFSKLDAAAPEPVNESQTASADSVGIIEPLPPHMFNASRSKVAIGRALTPMPACTQASSVTDCSTALCSKFPNTTEPSSMTKPSENFNSKHCNSPRSPTYMPIQMNAQPASTDHEVPSKVTSCSGTEPVATPNSTNALKSGTSSCMGFAGYNSVLAESPMDIYTCPDPQRVTSCNWCEDFAKAPENPEECNVGVGKAIHSPHRTETDGAHSETTICASSASVGLSGITSGCTTLAVRNIPPACTTEELLQTWPPDGTFDFLYLPYSFKQRRSACALVNFTSHAAALTFYSRWHKQYLLGQGPKAKLNISTATVQGLEENVRDLLRRKIVRVRNSKYLPLVFDGLREVPFSEFVEALGMRFR